MEPTTSSLLPGSTAVPVNSLNANETYFDIVIAGGGTIGTTLALALSQIQLVNRPLRIAIIEAKSLDFLAQPASNFSTSNSPASLAASPAEAKMHPGFDNRAIALSRHSLDFLAKLGSGNSLQQAIEQATAAIKDIHVSDQHHLGQSLLNADALGVVESGRVIELPVLGRILHSALNSTLQAQSAQPNAAQCQWFCPDTIEEVQITADQVTLTLHSQQELQAALLLVTEGGESSTRSQLPVVTETHDYQQSAVIVNVATSDPHDNRAFERFTETGPLAFLPMTGNRCSVVWTIARDQEQTVMQWNDAQFAAQLQRAFGFRLGKIVSVGQRHVYPLRLAVSHSQHLHRAALLGNAAQMLHPIAGQGFNLGLRDIEDLVETLVQFQREIEGDVSAKTERLDIGSYEVLAAFRRKRQKDAQQTILATHGLVHLFSNRDILPVIGRNLGLFAMDNTPFLKRWFGLKAMGVGRG